METVTTDNRVCGTCAYCVKDDGSPYCVLKDLYTEVKLDDPCDEYNSRGTKYWTEDNQ